MYGKPSTSVNRQAKYEAFLDSQDRKQRTVWFSCLSETVLGELTRAINQTKAALAFNEEKTAKFEANTLSKLRTMYAEIKQILSKSERGYEEERRSRELVGNMISQINGWFRSSKVAVGLKQEMDHRYSGNAAIPSKYELMISDDFSVTYNRDWQ